MVAKTVRVKLFRPPGVGTGTFFIIPFDVRAVFGRARAPVRVTLNRHTYRSTVSVYDGKYHMIVNAQNQEKSGVEAGDTVSVRLELDTGPRVVRMPKDLREAVLREPQAVAAWNRRSYTHRKEMVDAINAAKKPETRARRIGKGVAELLGR